MNLSLTHTHFLVQVMSSIEAMADEGAVVESLSHTLTQSTYSLYLSLYLSLSLSLYLSLTYTHSIYLSLTYTHSSASLPGDVINRSDGGRRRSCRVHAGKTRGFKSHGGPYTLKP